MEPASPSAAGGARVEGLWRYAVKGLDRDELDRVDGRRTELIGLLQQKYGQTREAAEREIDAWLSRN